MEADSLVEEVAKGRISRENRRLSTGGGGKRKRTKKKTSRQLRTHEEFYGSWGYGKNVSLPNGLVLIEVKRKKRVKAGAKSGILAEWGAKKTVSGAEETN